MAAYAYVGDLAYELVYKDDPGLTEAQARALAAEYTKLGVPWHHVVWSGYHCVIAKASHAAFDQYAEKLDRKWRAIQTRVGYNGLLKAKNNRYRPGVTQPNLGTEWDSVVAFIDSNYGPRRKKWWQFWK